MLDFGNVYCPMCGTRILVQDKEFCDQDSCAKDREARHQASIRRERYTSEHDSFGRLKKDRKATLLEELKRLEEE